MISGSAICSQNTHWMRSIWHSTVASPAGRNVLFPPLCSGTSPSPPPLPAGSSGTSAARAVQCIGTHFHLEDSAQPPFCRAQKEQLITGWNAGENELMRDKKRETEMGREQLLRLAGCMYVRMYGHTCGRVCLCVFSYMHGHTRQMGNLWDALVSYSVQFSSVHSVMSNSLWPHESQHARPPCPSPTPRVHPNSCPLSQWCHAAISSSVVPFSSYPQSLPASGSFPMSQLFTWCGPSIVVSASKSVLPMNTQDWSLGWTGWTSLQSKGLSRVFSNTTVQKH